MSSTHLRDILTEAYAWEREPGAPLPKLEDVMKKHNSNLQETRKQKSVLEIVEEAEDVVQNLRSNMATNSVLQREEKYGYLQAYDELLDLLSDIGYEVSMLTGEE